MQNLNLKQQERSYLTLSRIVLTITFIIISITFCVYLYLNGFSFLKITLAFVAAWIIYALLFVYQTAEYKHFRYCMNEHGLYINRGVFWRRKIIVPRNRVQHTDVVQGPLQRKYSLAVLVVHTAGTRNAMVKLSGILQKDAEKLRQSLSFQESNDAV